MFDNKNNTKDLQDKYNIPTRLVGSSSLIQNIEVLRDNEPNKRVTVIRDADGNIMSISERDLWLDIF